VQPISFSYQWQLCAEIEVCSNIGATARTYVLTGEDVGARIQVVVTAKDVDGEATTVTTFSTVVEAAAPVLVLAPSISGAALDGELLQGQQGLWTGPGPISLSYQWQSCNQSGAACVAIPGATEATYRLSDANLGATIRLDVTATSPHGQASDVTEPTSIVVAGPPVGETPALSDSLSTYAYPGEVVTATAGAHGQGPVSETYQWELCNGSGENCAAISGATGSSYTIVEGDSGRTIRVTVTYSNSHGADPVVSNVSGVVSDHAPIDRQPPALSFDDIGLGVGDAVTAEPGAWVGSQPISYAYQWQLCTNQGCSDVAGANEATFTVPATDTELRVQVTATNAQGTTVADSQASRVYGSGELKAVQKPMITGELKDGERSPLARANGTALRRRMTTSGKNVVNVNRPARS